VTTDKAELFYAYWRLLEGDNQEEEQYDEETAQV